MELSRQEYWSGLPFLSPEDLPDPRIKPWSPTLQADSLLSGPPGKPKTSCLPIMISSCDDSYKPFCLKFLSLYSVVN